MHRTNTQRSIANWIYTYYTLHGSTRYQSWWFRCCAGWVSYCHGDCVPRPTTVTRHPQSTQREEELCALYDEVCEFHNLIIVFVCRPRVCSMGDFAFGTIYDYQCVCDPHIKCARDFTRRTSDGWMRCRLEGACHLRQVKFTATNKTGSCGAVSPSNNAVSSHTISRTKHCSVDKLATRNSSFVCHWYRAPMNIESPKIETNPPTTNDVIRTDKYLRLRYDNGERKLNKTFGFREYKSPHFLCGFLNIIITSFFSPDKPTRLG